MISIEEAQLKVIENLLPKRIIRKKALESLNYILAKDLNSPVNLPLFNQSAMDGYAVKDDRSEYEVVGKIKAGDNAERFKLENTQAVRIYTGAMIPDGTTRVIMQEDVDKIGDNNIVVKDISPTNHNIRFEGEELEKGEIAIHRGTVLNSAAIGLVSTLGISDIEVFDRPKIRIIETGSELLDPGEALIPGKIFGSNGIMLQSLLQNYGFTCMVDRVEDNYNKTKSIINIAIDSSDVVIVTGGISVGDFDFVEQVLEESQVEKVFYKINQKPGKPMYFGRKKDVNIFALPGNPAATLTCFFMYVLPCLKALSGNSKPLNESKYAILNSDFAKKGNRTYLLKGLYNQGSVEVLKGQSSAMLSAFIEANCLIKLNGDTTAFKKGDLVECYPIV